MQSSELCPNAISTTKLEAHYSQLHFIVSFTTNTLVQQSGYECTQNRTIREEH